MKENGQDPPASNGLSALPDRLPTGRNPRFTGSRLARRDPEKFEAIFQALKDGEGVTAIAKRLRCSAHTVQVIHELLAGELPLPKRLSKQWVKQLFLSGPERVDEEFAKLNVVELAKVMGFGIDLALALERSPEK